MKTTNTIVANMKLFVSLSLITLIGCAEPEEHDITSFINTYGKQVDALRAVYSKGEKVESITVTNRLIIDKFLKATSYSSQKDYWINTRANKGACDFYLLSQGKEIAEISFIKLSAREGFVDFRARNYTNDSLLVFSQKVLGLF